MTCVVVIGAVSIDRISQDVSITANTFLSNSALGLGSSGGAIFAATFTIAGTVITSPNTFGTGPQANSPQDVFPLP